VDLPRPRNVVDARFQPGFEALYERLWADLREEVMRTYEKRA
jgi:NitT/TauT family transport system ATP-binding protein